MEGKDVLREEMAQQMVEHFVASKANVATPDDPMAKLRRQVLRGLRGAGGAQR
jgi:hypothetical protein